MLDVIVTHSPFASHPTWLAVCALLWLYDVMAALLYVRVEGEEPIGEEKLQEGDSVQSVVKRAVEGNDINSIFWKDVAGWKLRDSRDEDAKEVKSGTSSERLSKLLPFPDESLLILTRRPVPPITTGSALGEDKIQNSAERTQAAATPVVCLILSFSLSLSFFVFLCLSVSPCLSLSLSLSLSLFLSLPSLSLSAPFSFDQEAKIRRYYLICEWLLCTNCVLHWLIVDCSLFDRSCAFFLRRTRTC